MKKTIQKELLEKVVIEALREVCQTRDLQQIIGAGKIAERILTIVQIKEICNSEGIAYLNN